MNYLSYITSCVSISHMSAFIMMIIRLMGLLSMVINYVEVVLHYSI